MQNGLPIPVNKVVQPNKAEILDLIWKGINEGDVAVIAHKTSEQQAIANTFDSDDNQPAGWLRNSPIAGL